MSFVIRPHTMYGRAFGSTSSNRLRRGYSYSISEPEPIRIQCGQPVFNSLVGSNDNLGANPQIKPHDMLATNCFAPMLNLRDCTLLHRSRLHVASSSRVQSCFSAKKPADCPRYATSSCFSFIRFDQLFSLLCYYYLFFIFVLFFYFCFFNVLSILMLF